MTRSDQFYLSDIQVLRKHQSTREAKYRRNYNRYVNNGSRSENIWQQYGNPVAYYFPSVNEDSGVIPILNIIKSVISTVVSKIAQIKVRPFFNPVVGRFKTRKICRNAQVFFDEFFAREGIFRRLSLAFRDACVFEYGAIWIDEQERKIHHIGPWEFETDPAEYYFLEGRFTRYTIYRRQYPLTLLRDLIKGSRFEALLEISNDYNVTYEVYYNLEDHIRLDVVNNEILRRTKIAFDVPNVVLLYFDEPFKGMNSSALADDLYTIQRQIDAICVRMHMAIELNPGNLILVPQGSGIKTTTLTSEFGAMVEYKVIPGVTQSPVTVATPAPISPQYMQLLLAFIQWGFEFTGVSQLSAQQKKPADVDSGKALETLQDIESERFQVIVDNVEDFAMRVAETCIHIFPPGDTILPKVSGRPPITWGQLLAERDSYTVQFSSTSALSKTPQIKYQQIEKLIGMKLLTPPVAMRMLELPDLENAYGIMNASSDDCQRIIERAVEDEDYTFFEVVNIEELYRESVGTLLRLDSNDEDRKVMERLVKLIEMVDSKRQAVENVMNPPQPTLPTPQGQIPGSPPQAPAPGGNGQLPVAPGAQVAPPAMSAVPGVIAQ